MWSRAQIRLSVLEVHNNNCKNANDPLERTLAPTIKETKHNHAVGHRMQFACRYAQSVTQLRSVINAAIKQHDKSIGEEEGLALKQIFRR